MRTLIHGGTLIPMTGPDAQASTVADGALLIDGDRIAAVGPAATLAAEKDRADRVIDARGSAILPGFVNTHTHLAGAITKALTEDVPTYGGPFRIALGMHENVITAADMYLPGLVHGIEMLKTGTTTINECWWHQPQSARIMEAVGLRGMVAAEVREVDSSKIGFGRFEREWDQRLVDEGFAEAEELFENWHGKGGGRIQVWVAPDGPDRLRPETMARLGELAARHKAGIHTHLCAVPGENEFMLRLWGKKSIPLLKELGMLGPKFVGAHCVYMDDEDIAMMAESGAWMSHTAFLCGKRGYYPPIRKVYESGMNVALGSDWLSNDMFNVMRAGIIIARVLDGRVAIRSAADVLRMATVEGARALGLDGEVGTLEPGKRADVILVDMATARCMPARPQNVVTNLVYNASGGDVTHVWVDGECLVDDRRFTRMDEREVLREAQGVAESVWARSSHLFAAENMP